MSEETRCCAICGQAIKPGRLKILPETRLCIVHAEQIDELGGEFKLLATRTTLGKTGSMKKNYGDTSAHLVRNDDAMQKLRDEFNDAE